MAQKRRGRATEKGKKCRNFLQLARRVDTYWPWNVANQLNIKCCYISGMNLAFSLGDSVAWRARLWGGSCHPQITRSW